MLREKREIKIGVNKTKAWLMTLFIGGLFSVTIWALTKILPMNPGSDKIFLMIGILLLSVTFGILTIVGFKQTTDNTQGLVINDKGIGINIGPNRGQFIKWTDIEEIKIHSPAGSDICLSFYIKNPADIFKKSKGINRFFLKMNNIKYKTPVCITSTWLELNLLEIIEIIEEKIKKTLSNKL